MGRLIVALILAAVLLSVFNSDRALTTTQGPLKPVTVCDVLQTLNALNGKLVAVLGRLQESEEGRWLAADNCPVPLKTDGFQWRNIIFLHVDESIRSGNTTEMTFETDALRRALREAGQHTALRQTADRWAVANRWAVVYGRLETHEKLVTVTMTDGTLYGYGFGHLNAAPAQLVFSFKTMKVFTEPEVQELLKTG